MSQEAHEEVFTPFNEDGNLRDPSELGFQTVGAFRDDGPRLLRDADEAAAYPWISYGDPRPKLATGQSDIIDRIDELVNDQLANYDRRSGYDHNVNQDKCWHCGRDWHGLKITQRIESMRSFGLYDEDYSYADDDSEVLCWGSEFIGPMKYPPVDDKPPFRRSRERRTEAERREIQWQVIVGGQPRYTVAVLTETAPTIGGTWEPVTAPGVTTYPTEAL